jgi:hypothetical protein
MNMELEVKGRGPRRKRQLAELRGEVCTRLRTIFLENLSAQRTLSEHAWPASIVASLLGETKSDSRPQSPAKDWEPK